MGRFDWARIERERDMVTEQQITNIQKYLDDAEYYRLKSSEITSKRKYRNFFCKGENGIRVPIKEIGDVFGLFESLSDDHSHKLLTVLLDMGIPVYAKRKYDSLDSSFDWAVDNGLLIFLDTDTKE